MTDIEALRAAIDAGQDDALPILADALEDKDDPRAAGLRKFAHRPAREPNCRPWRRQMEFQKIWAWVRHSAGVDAGPGVLACAVFDKLDHDRVVIVGPGIYGYPTRSDAYLALAEALSEVPAGESP